MRNVFSDTFDALKRIAEPVSVLKARIGFAGFQATMGVNELTLKQRVGSMFYTVGAMIHKWHYIRRGARLMFYRRNPKIYDFGGADFVYGEAKGYRLGKADFTGATFEELYAVSTLFL